VRITNFGNGGADIKIRMAWNGLTSGGEYNGTWLSGSTYTSRDLVIYPTGSQLMWRANQSTTAGQSPDTNPEKWDLEVGLEMVQNIGSGKYTRYLLGIRNDDMIRINGIHRGTYATSAFTRRSSYYDDYRGASSISTSVTSMVLGSSHPSAKSLTISAGLTMPNSSTIGSSSDNFAIPTTHPTLLTINLGAGLGLSIGNSVTMYGDANNFFVYVIARYDNATGVAYGASTVHVGSGTFSSWTIKSERLIYGERTADTAGKNFYALVQSYDSGTGVINFNTVNNTGTGTHSDWTLRVAKEPFTIPGTNATRYNGNQSNNAFGTYGLWHRGDFEGDRLIHNCTVATNGTGWIYVYGSGADDSDIPDDVEIDTYNGSTLNLQTKTVFTGLTKGNHTFIAFSKVSANGLSTNTRPYVDAGTTTPNYSFFEQYEYDSFTTDITAGPVGGESFGEIAYRIRDTDGGDTAQWVPEHSNVQTLLNRSNRVFTIDGVVADHEDENDFYMLKFQSFTTASLTQLLDVVHPQATGNMGSLSVTHNFSNQGLYYKLILTWLQAGVIETGYNNMVFLGDAWWNKAKAQNEEIIIRPAVDNTSENLTADQKDQGSYLFYSTGADPLDTFVLGQYWPNPTRDWRIGGANLGTPFVQDFSTTNNAKFYPFVYSGYSFALNEVMTIEARLYAGNKGTLDLT